MLDGTIKWLYRLVDIATGETLDEKAMSPEEASAENDVLDGTEFYWDKEIEEEV